MHVKDPHVIHMPEFDELWKHEKTQRAPVGLAAALAAAVDLPR